MTDMNPSAKTHEPTIHLCDAPGLGPRAFLLAIMHDPQLPIHNRMHAAHKLLRIYVDESVKPRLTYRIEGIPSCNSSSAEAEAGTADRITANDSDSSPLAQIPSRHSDEAKAAVNIETNTDTLTPTDIQQIKAKVQQLYPDADLSNTPDHLTLCECVHWMLFPCKCASINRARGANMTQLHPETNGHGTTDTRRALRDLNHDYRETISALMGAHASINRALKLTEDNYQRKRKAIINGHDETEAL